MDDIITNYTDPWLNDVATMYQEKPVIGFSRELLGYARTIEVSEVSSDCERHNPDDPSHKPYRSFTTRLRTWEYIEGIGQGCPLLDVSIKVNRRHEPTPAGNLQSGEWAFESIVILLQHFFSNGGVFTGAPHDFYSNANLSTECVN